MSSTPKGLPGHPGGWVHDEGLREDAEARSGVRGGHSEGQGSGWSISDHTPK